MKSYFLYVHSDKESSYESASDAGFTAEEIEKYGLIYAGYEIKLRITVPGTDGRKYDEEMVDINETFLGND